MKGLRKGIHAAAWCAAAWLWASCISSTETGNCRDGGTSTETGNCRVVEVVSVDISRGKVDPVNTGIISADSSSIDFDTSVAVIARSSNRLYLVADTISVSQDLGDNSTYWEVEADGDTVLIRDGTIYPVLDGLAASVMNLAGESFQGVRIELRRASFTPLWNQSNPAGYAETSDTLGIALFPNLLPGAYLAVGRDAEENPLFLRPVQLDSGRGQLAIFKEAVPQSVTGSFRRESGLSVDSIHVYLSGSDVQALTTPDGGFDLGALPPGGWSVDFTLNSVALDSPLVSLDTIPNPTLADSAQAGLCNLRTLTGSGDGNYRVDSSSTLAQWIIQDVDAASCQ